LQKEFDEYIIANLKKHDQKRNITKNFNCKLKRKCSQKKHYKNIEKLKVILFANTVAINPD